MKNKNNDFIGTSLTAVSLLCFLLGCQRTTRTFSNQEVNIGMSQEFENLNPLTMQALATTYLYAASNRTLVTMDPDSKWIPLLADSIPTLENGQAEIYIEKDQKKLKATWQIKEKAKWGDGTPISGYDVVFAWTVARNNNVSVGDREIYDQIERIDVDQNNPKKFVMYFKRAKWDFNTLGTFYVLPKHLEEEVYKKYAAKPEGYQKNSLYNTNPTLAGLYGGPFRVTELKLGSHVTMERNPYFYGSQPHIKKVNFKFIPNTQTLEANLRSGTIDMISVLGLQLDQALALEKNVDRDKLPFKVHFQPSLTYEHIDLQLKNKILKDVRVRRALVYAIDREALSQSLFEGKQRPALHFLSPKDPWFTQDPKTVIQYPYSRRKAIELLEEAGWVLHPKDGIRYQKETKLAFELMTTADNKTRELVQAFLKEQWNKVGIEIEIKNEPARVFFGETVRKGGFSGMAMFAWISSPESTPRSTLHSKSIPTNSNGFSGQNAPGWSNPEVDNLIDQIDVEFDPLKRLEKIHRIVYLYTQDVPVIPLFYRADVAVTPKAMSGYRLPGHQFTETNHIETWSVE